jgi:RNA polymerase sigma-70 factor (ECF subfamily)
MIDSGRFEAFVREYQDMVFATAVRLLGNPAEAEDVAQTVFMKAFERFRELESSVTVAGWLKTVTTNLCLNHLARYRARWQFFSELDPAGPDGASSFASTLVAPTEAVADPDATDRQERLETALRALPDHQRVPLVLFHFDDLSYHDIAAKLGVSLSKVKSDIFRGRETLKKTLGIA